MSDRDVTSPRQKNSRAASAREVAWRVLRAVAANPGVDAQADLIAQARGAGLSERDQSLAFEIVQGVLRWRRCLDAIVGSLEGFKKAQIYDDLADVLRIGVYQHAFLDRIPPHAVVNETVSLARLATGPRSTSFVNAALQKMLRQFPDRVRLDALTSTLPMDVRYSLPPWLLRLVRREIKALPTRFSTSIDAALDALNQPLPLYCRATLAGESVSLAALLKADGLEVLHRPDLAPACLEAAFPATARVLAHELFRKGRLFAQDASAQLTALFVGARPGDTVLDWCAAPGGKTAALADAMNRQGRLVALDFSGERLKRMRENLVRLGLQDFVKVRAHSADGFPGCSERAAPMPLPVADRVLVDAPCSGLGTLRRHPEIRWRVHRHDLESLAETQLSILDAAARHVRPGGLLIYSTCSFAREENEDVVERFLERQDGCWDILREREGLDPSLALRVDEQGWLRVVPGRDAMDSARAVRLLFKG